MKKIFVSTLLCISQLSVVYAQYDWALDSLKKYSYLLVEAEYFPKFEGGENNIQNYEGKGNGTGFFIKSQNRLYLVSAYHVLTGFDLISGRYFEGIGSHLIIFYNDTVPNRLNFRSFRNTDLRTLSGLPGFYNQRPDVETIDVTNLLLPYNVNSIENFSVEESKKYKEKNVKRTVISYGFPGYLRNNYKDWMTHAINAKPTPYFAKLADSVIIDTTLLKNLNLFGFLCAQYTIPGVSGSPAFFYCTKRKKRWIEFAGVVWGTNIPLNLAYITRREFLFKNLNEKAPN